MLFSNGILRDSSIPTQVVEGFLHLVIFTEAYPEQDTRNQGRHTDTCIHDHKLWVFACGREGDAEGRTECSLEEEEGHDDRLHGGRGLGECVLEPSDGCENLRKTNEDIGRGLDRNMDFIWDLSPVRALIGKWKFVTWAG